MTSLIVVHASLIKGKSVVTLSDKLPLDINTPYIAEVNGNEYVYELTHNEYIITFLEDIGIKDGDLIRIC